MHGSLLHPFVMPFRLVSGLAPVAPESMSVCPGAGLVGLCSTGRSIVGLCARTSLSEAQLFQKGLHPPLGTRLSISPHPADI